MNLDPTVQIVLIGALLLIILVLVFRRRVAQVELGPAKLMLFKPEEQEELANRAKQIASKEIASASPTSSLHWDRVATLFWLGNDLMWISDMIYRGAPPDRVLQGVNHAKQYLVDLGFSQSSAPLVHLTNATNVLEALIGPATPQLIERGIVKQHYETVAQEVQAVKWQISALAEQRQPGFKKLRAL